MIKKNLILALIFILIGLFGIIYKFYFSEISNLPSKQDRLWDIEYSFPIDKSTKQISFPLFDNRYHLQIIQSFYSSKNSVLDIESHPEGRVAKINFLKNKGSSGHLRVRVQLDLNTFKNSKVRRYEAKKFLKILKFDTETQELINTTNSELDLINLSPREKAKQIFHFLSEEILKNTERRGIKLTLFHLSGSSYDRSQLFTIFCRKNAIPARTVRGVILSKSSKTKWAYWNEVYLNKKWTPLSINKNTWGHVPKNYIPLYQSIDFEHPFDKQKNKSFKIRLAQLKTNLGSQSQKRLEASSFFGIDFELPLSLQFSYKLMLLFSLGALVLCLCRNFIGLKPFGIFFPILLAIFFKATSLKFGLVFLSSILCLGLLERFFLVKLYILAVPRMAILMTLMILTLFLYLIFNPSAGWSEHNPILLPIVISTLFIERFAVTFEENGIKSTLFAIFSTVIISILCLGIFSWENLENFLYLNPESLLINIGLFILIGSYTGFRLTEWFRFRKLDPSA